MFKNSAHVNAASAKPSFAFDAHVQGIGTIPSVKSSSLKEGAVFGGTTGQSKRLESVKIRVLNKPSASMKISYRAHVQKYGWLAWVDEGAMAGTEGESKRMEAIELSVEGAEGYHVMYRAHVQKIGWQDWVEATNSKAANKAEPVKGTFAGTTGEKKRIEAIEIAILSDSQNDLLKLQDDAVAQLRSTFNPADYTINKEEFEKAMDEAVKAIYDVTDAANIDKTLKEQIGATKVGKVLTDEAQKTATTNYKNGLIGELTNTYINTALDGNIKGVEPAIAYKDYPSVKAAIETAKETIKNAELYHAKELDTLAVEQKTAIYNAVKAAVTEVVENRYADNVKAKDNDDEVVTTEGYTAALKGLEEAKPGAETPANGDLTKLTGINENMKTFKLSVVKGDLKTRILGTNFKTKYLNDKIATKDTNTIGNKFGLVEAEGSETYADITKVKAVLTKAEVDIDSSTSYAQMESIVETAKKDALKELENYMATVVMKLQSANNGSGYTIGESNVVNAVKYNALKNTTKIEDITALISAYETEILGNVTQQTGA